MSEPEFEWDEAKREANLVKHGLDFRDAFRVMSGRTLNRVSPRGDEARFVAVGMLNERLVSVVWTPRDGRMRVISMRRARREEEREYRQLHG